VAVAVEIGRADQLSTTLVPVWTTTKRTELQPSSHQLQVLTPYVPHVGAWRSNTGKAKTQQYFVLNNLCARIDDLVVTR
jgi:hypothetical protein